MFLKIYVKSINFSAMLNISIVLYRPNSMQLQALLKEIVKVKCLNRIYLIDNSPMKSSEFVISDKIRYIFNEGRNLGYGKGHNIAIRESIYDGIDFHLVMNADVVVHAEDIDAMHHFIEHEPLVGQLIPRVIYPDGSLQYVAKLLPTPLDVFGRRFLPEFLMRRRNARYELQQANHDKPFNAPSLSGCFMFMRTKAVLQAHLFDERYFLYPEDVDLTRSIHKDWLTIYWPAVTIVHHHARGSYKSWHLLWVHIVNMCRYFNKWGWFFDPERRRMNKETLASIKPHE